MSHVAEVIEWQEKELERLRAEGERLRALLRKAIHEDRVQWMQEALDAVEGLSAKDVQKGEKAE